MKPPGPSTMWYCLVCRTALDVITENDKPYRYMHSLATTRRKNIDHEPLPVPASELDSADTICDFCASTEVTWAYVSDDIVSSDAVPLVYEQQGRVVLDLSKSMGTSWGARWAACDMCAELIERGARNALLNRALKSMDLEPSVYRQTRAWLSPVYVKFFATLKGRAPVTEGHPFGEDFDGTR